MGSDVNVNLACTLPYELAVGSAFLFPMLSDGNDHFAFPLYAAGGSAGSSTIFIQKGSGGYTSGYSMTFAFAMLCI